MIPVRLTLRNFMPYQDNVPPLDFTGIHTASICGDNGNGKSALIDAITWALWGRARGKSDDELVHQGRMEMAVEFDFAVAQQTYRIIRKHALPKRRRASGQSSLDLQIASNGSFKPISGDRISETQCKIIDILHMDYDTFVNSAYLRQGHADQFTVADPAKRKQVLGSILGLSQYDDLERRARELAGKSANDRVLFEIAIRDIDSQLAERPAYETRLGEAQSQLSAAEKAAREQEVRLIDLRQKKEQLLGKQRELTQLEEDMAGTRKMSEQLARQAELYRSRVKEYEGLIVGRAVIEEGYAQFTDARRQNEALNEKQGRLLKLSERKSQLERAIQKAQGQLLTEHALAQREIDRLETEHQKLSQLRNGLQQAQAELRRLAEQEAGLLKKRQASQETVAGIRLLEASAARLAQEVSEIEEKLDLLSSHRETKCPLCERELGVDGIRVIEAKYLAEKREKNASLESNQATIAQRKTESEIMSAEIAQLETGLNRDRALRQGELTLLSRQIGEAERAGIELGEARSRLADVEERMARKDFAVIEQEALLRLESELSQISYDGQQHEEVRRRLATLEQHEGPKRRLEEAERNIVPEKAALSSVEQTLQELHSRLETASRRRQELSLEVGSLPQLTDDLAHAEAEHRRLSAQQTQAQETVGNIRGKLQHLAEMEIRRGEKQRDLNRAAGEERIYQELSEAFGKKGIQALLIEQALPEIEDEANRLLARMTDNRMHVKFETQRETRKGDVVETLDIQIADELGTRSYEMFSGGESFRINLAIRIALSRLLVRRAGAPLPTLFIDEGFGTQDSTGLEKLKEAIASIQDDFEKILVITHVEELRDAFPTRIDVVKTAEGSMLEISV